MLRKHDFKSENLFDDSTGKYRFLGTLAGEQNFLFCKIIQENTYTRIYKQFGLSSELREDILKQEAMEMGGEGFKKIGEVYSFTPSNKRDGRHFGDGTNCNNIRTNLAGGGFFLTVKKYTRDEAAYHFNNFSYAVNMFPELEQLANDNMQTLLKQVRAYGINFIAHQYFKGVAIPKDGDLVIYEKEGKPTHAGIYRITQSNWNSPGGGTVESKWPFFSNPYVFQHDIFFIPSHFGDTARFYRIQNYSPSYQASTYNIIQATFIYHCSPDGFFIFGEDQKEIDIKRKKLDSMPSDEIVSKFPEIKRIDYINYFGVCYHYAFSKVFKTYVSSEIPADPTINNRFVEENFINIVMPQAGDLVVYYAQPQHSSAVHYGIYDSNDCIESKWGADSVYKHPPFLVPKKYGNYLKFWRLKTTSDKKHIENDVDLTENEQKFKSENQSRKI